ncbi:MAG: TlpA disulfide reductase family protein [Bacteroidota bacterium]
MLKYIILILSFQFTLLEAQEINRIGVNDLEGILENPENVVNVVNFWATWCGPCVTELPYFQEVAGSYKNENVEFLLISLDFPSQVDSRLKPFLEEKNIELPVILMQELDYNKWISLVDPQWKGNLPATLVFNNAENKRSFVSGAIKKQELIDLIEKNLN